ncbi:hypothetical protein KR009_008909 [Drosophila setifemur]|nr:hypothetical protein KR009_008909 [Drosophila setifemur]
MRRRSERKKSSSPAPVPARRSRRSLKVSENEKTEDEAPPVQEEQPTPAAREENSEARASSEERSGSPVRKSRGSRSTPKKRTEAKNVEKKVETIPEEEAENGQDAGKHSAPEDKKPEIEPEAEKEKPSIEQEASPEENEKVVEENEKQDKPQADADEGDGDKQSSQVQEVKVPSPSVSLTASKDEEQLKTTSDVLDIQTEDVEERDDEAPARKAKKKPKDPKPEREEPKRAAEEEQKENRKHEEKQTEIIQVEAAILPKDKHEASENSNQNNSTIATATVPGVVLQQQRSVRKRKWITNKKPSDRVPPVLAISTDSLKNIIADVVQPVPLSDVQLDSSSEEEGLVNSDRDSERSISPDPAKEHEMEGIQVTTSAELTADQEGVEGAAGKTTPPLGASDSTPSKGGQSKVSTVSTATPHVVRSPSPARNRASHVLYITNLVRPFTVLQLKGLLARTGKIVEEDGFWIDRIKSKCFVAYSTEDEAIETRHALHGVRWPVSNPKCLNVDFGSRTDMDRAIQSTKDDAPKYSQENTRDNQQPGNAWSRLEASDKKPVRPVREWDVGKKEPTDQDKAGNDRRRGSKDRLDARSRDAADRPGQERKGSRKREIRVRDRERVREYQERTDRNTQAHSRSGSPAAKAKKKENEPPIRLLDDLFRKTKGTPCIYWLPLTPEAIAEKEALRQKRIEEHKLRIKEREERQKEREKDRDRQRETRRNRSNERRRSRSRERERRRY